MQHIIIGAGPAGVIAAETLKKIDPHATVTLIGDEPEPPYSRMALPYYLNDKIGEEGTWLRKDNNHFAKAGITLLQDRVSSVDSKAQTLTLQQQSSPLSYDRLLIATGSSPIRPPIPGMDLKQVHSCWTLEDGRAIANLAKPGANVTLIGAGFIGCIILEALAARGVKLTVVEMGDRMVPRMMNQTAGNLLKQWCQDQGVVVHTSTGVQSIEKGGLQDLKVKLSNGETIKANLVICATGVRSNFGFLQGSGIKTGDGVLVNQKLQTNIPEIYSAGDVCQGMDFSTGEYSVQAIQPTAADHGRIAAMNMAGKNSVHKGCVNMNVLDTLGLISTSYGLWMGVDGGESAELSDPGRYRYLNLQFEDDVIVGAQAVGLTAHVGVLRGLIQTKLRLGKWKKHLLHDPTRIMEAYLGATQAIGHNAGII